MEISNQNVNSKSKKSEKLENELKKRYSLEGNALFSNDRVNSEIFIKNNTMFDKFSILKINLERATLREASTFKEFIEKSISEDGKNIIVDLNSCEFVDSSFFGVLVGGLKRMRALGMKFFIIYDSENKLPIFSTTGLDKVFTVFSKIEDAVNS